MKPRRLPILETLVAAYRDLGSMATAMRTLTLSAILINIAIAVVADLVPQRLWLREPSGEALGLVEDAVWAFLLAPFVIAVHRFVIRGDVTRAYTLPVGEPFFRIFVAWLFALKVFVGLPVDLLGVLQAFYWSLSGSTLVFAAAVVAVVAVLLRLSILLPACAVAAPGATPSHAFADTKGEALRLLALFFLALLPWVAVTFGAVFLLGPTAQIVGTPRAMVALVLDGILQTGMLAVTAVIASYAFMALAAQVKRAA